MHKNHRKHLDEKFDQFGLEGLEEHEMLELFLFAVIPRKNTNELAHTLIDTYGTLGGVLTAEIKDLESIEGVGHRTAVFLHSLPQLSGAIQRGMMKRPLRFNTQEELEKYVQSFFLGKVTEEAYMFCLNAANKLMSHYRLSKGIGSETYIYPKIVVKRAILANADKVVIAHNHPYGVSKPSSQDVLLAKSLLKALDAVDIELKDSIVVAKGECYSLRNHGHLPPRDNIY